jgi:hypothetical protein
MQIIQNHLTATSKMTLIADVDMRPQYFSSCQDVILHHLRHILQIHLQALRIDLQTNASIDNPSILAKVGTFHLVNSNLIDCRRLPNSLKFRRGGRHPHLILALEAGQVGRS